MQSLNETLSIDTPENVAFGYTVAGIGSRFLSAMLDSGILTVIILSIYFIFAILANVMPDGANSETQYIVYGIATVIVFLLFWGYYIFFELIWNGQTPGKRWVGLRVVCLNGAPITLVESIIRNLVRVIDFLPAYYGVGLVVMFFNPQARRLGDLAANTLVIYDQGAATIDSIKTEMTARTPIYMRYDTTLSLTGLETSLLSPRTIELAEVFLRRRHAVGNQQELALQILKLIEHDLGGPVISGSGYFTPVDQIAAVINEVRK